MPQLPSPLQAALRQAVATRFGQPVRYPSDCDTLEQVLAGSPAVGRVSPSTLRRFFGLVEKVGGYHLHTLDALARYAGHADFAAFERAVLGQAATPAAPDMLVLLALPGLGESARLLLGYYAGLAERPALPTGPASALALRLAAHPTGQQFFVESFVDLAHLAGSYGEVVAEYLRHKATPEAQLFGHATLFLRELLADEEPAWRARLRQLRALPVPASIHAFPRGRQAFAEVLAAWHDAPGKPLSPALLCRLKQQAATVPASPAPPADLPAFYNHFPAGYHFLVAEALFLTRQFAALTDWLAFTAVSFPALATLEHNVYNELLRTFAAAASGQPYPGWQALYQADMRSWLLDYYQVHVELSGLHVAGQAGQPDAAARHRTWINRFAVRHGMPLFARLADAVPC